MDVLIVAGFILLVLLTAVLLVYLFKQMQQVRQEVQSRVNQLQDSVTQRFDANVQAVTSHLGIITGQINNTTNVVASVEGKLGQMQEATKQIFDLARQMSSLQDILQSPKARGGLGEFLLQDLLSQCLRSDSYRLQHSFRNGTVVDAALFVGKNILCVDSKFPLENFRRMVGTESEPERKTARKQFLADVKKHVNDIAEKYILPDEKTFNFALMFIPAENVYYELIVRDQSDLYEHCWARRVIPVSPNSFYAYLQVIVQGLRGFQISEQAREVLSHLQQLSNDLNRFHIDFAKLGGHLRDACSSFEKSDLKLQRIKKKVASLGTGLEETEEVAEPREIEDPPAV